jgi:conjugative transfer pilus assembly protein TraH
VEKKLRVAVCATAFAASLVPLNGCAGWMDDFYNSAGTAANITPAAAINSHNVIGYSLGGVSWRVPNKTLQPFQITPPSFRAGCGGIDAYLGSYSFVNKDAFVQALRNFGQAAVGYFFALALRSMAPEIAVTLDAINDMAQKINSMSINSCAAAKTMVNSIAGDLSDGAEKRAASYVRSVGQAVDQFDADQNFVTNGIKDAFNQAYQQEFGKSASAVTQGETQTHAPATEVNVLYYLIQNSNINATADEINLMLSLVGHQFIARLAASADGDSNLIADSKPDSISFRDLVGSATGGATSFQVWQCDTSSQCLNPTQVSEQHMPFAAIAYGTIEQIRNAVGARAGLAAGLTPQQQTVLKLSSVPLYRVAAMAAGTGSGAALALQLQEELAEYAGLEAAVNFVNYYLTAILRSAKSSSAKLDKPLQQQIPLIEARIAEVRRQMYAEIQRVYSTKRPPYEKIAQLEKIEQAMYSNLNLQLAANAKFNHRH